MNQKPTPQRLVYGTYPGVDAGDGELFDAESLVRLASIAAATTWRELVEIAYDTTYEQFIEEYEVGEIGQPDEPADFGAWYSESYELSPQQIAWDVAHSRVAEVVATEPAAFSGLSSGGSSPAGHDDTIRGPLGELARLAEQVDPARDGFTIERDDESITAVFGPLYT